MKRKELINQLSKSGSELELGFQLLFPSVNFQRNIKPENIYHILKLC